MVFNQVARMKTNVKRKTSNGEMDVLRRSVKFELPKIIPKNRPSKS